MPETHLFTSESVTEGHPDKIADQISDAVLDAMLTGDPLSRVACEVLVTTGMVLVSGEITSKSQVAIPDLARSVIRDIGYTRSEYGLDAETCAVLSAIDKQSPDIKDAVDRDGAGDQGLMFGYACRDTKSLMPLPIVLAHRLTKRLSDLRKNGTLAYLRPDGKSQVTVEFSGRRPARVTTVVLSSQHDPDVSQERIREDLIEQVTKPVLASEEIDTRAVQYHINPSGRFVTGGPQGDCGLTGRKIIVDTYGGWSRHGGGAFSGKDPSKVDRSASYAARHIAKHIVAAGLADEAEVQLAYAIGVAEPVSVFVETFGSAHVDTERLSRAVRETFSLTPRGMIEALGLREPIYRKTAAYGHFGREEDGFSWERLDLIEKLKDRVGQLKSGV
ncbi:MAG: methionine adenosyltransferase [Candidatus Latescibacterota bacterium]|nr:MAG: methionine adenosyltransferase [Candidatus Latescibacterota bacterium]